MKVGYSSSYDDGILIEIQAFDTEEEIVPSGWKLHMLMCIDFISISYIGNWVLFLYGTQILSVDFFSMRLPEINKDC